MVITDDAGQRQRLATRRATIAVATPLELVFALEDPRGMISTVVLAGRFVLDQTLVSFLAESYPQIRIDWLGVEAN